MSGRGATGVVVRRATPADEDAVLGLVRRAGLSVPGVVEHLTDFLVAERGGTVVAAMGLEHRGADALLRSAVVHETERGQGIGDTLYHALLADAISRDVRTLYLLTTSAEGYWARRGFTAVPRAAVPERVRESEEFRGACPASAAAMRLALHTRDTASVGH